MKFFKEIFARFRMESPSFFKIIQLLSVLTAAITGLPALIAEFQTQLGMVVVLDGDSNDFITIKDNS